jgi:hypothetical protein
MEVYFVNLLAKFVDGENWTTGLPENLKKHGFFTTFLLQGCQNRVFQPNSWRKLLIKKNNWTPVSAFFDQHHWSVKNLEKVL